MSAQLQLVSPQNQVDPEAWSAFTTLSKSPTIEFFHASIAVLAKLPQPTINDLFKLVGRKLNLRRAEFDEAFRQVRAAQRPTMIGERPFICVSDRSLNEVSGDAVRALEAANEPPVLFIRAGGLAMVQVDEQGRAAITRVDPLQLRSRLARVATFGTVSRGGNTTLCSPPITVVQDVLVSGEGRFPAVVGITNIPPLHEDGTVRNEPGYDAATQMYFQPEPGFRLGEVPDQPAAEHAAAAAHSLLSEVFGDFPFDSDTDRANALAALLTAVLRPCFRFKVPLFACDAPSPGSGKGLLASAIAVVTNGLRPEASSLPENEAEMRKTITALLEGDARVVIFDNVSRTVRSGVLAGLLTCDMWSDRLLGRTETFKGPNSAIWFATGNNIAFSREMARRICRIRLDPKTARPESRKGFKRPDEELLNFVQQERGAVVGAALTMARAWIMAGRPKAHVPTLGSFNHWAQTVGSILGFAGVNGFLENLDQVRAEADEETAEWELFLEGWVRFFGGDPVAASAVAGTFQKEELLYLMPDDLSEHFARQDANLSSFNKRLAKAFARKVGTRFGDRELRIERCAADGHSKVGMWRVAGNLAGLAPGSKVGSKAAPEDSHASGSATATQPGGKANGCGVSCGVSGPQLSLDTVTT